jgi:hypothetical protein
VCKREVELVVVARESFGGGLLLEQSKLARTFRSSGEGQGEGPSPNLCSQSIRVEGF